MQPSIFQNEFYRYCACLHIDNPVDITNYMGGEKMKNVLAFLKKYLKWIGLAIGAFFIMRGLKKKSHKDVDIKFDNAMKEITDRRKKLEKEKKNERKRIKNMGKRDRILAIKRLLNNSKNDSI